MADGGKIYITISDKRPESENESSEKSKTKKSKEDTRLQTFAIHSLSNLAKSQAKEIISYSVNNIGNFTGDYQSQRDIEFGLSITNKFLDLGKAFFAGTIATGSPIGGAIAMGVSMIATTISTIEQENANIIQNRKVNYDIELLRKRAGLDEKTNGSRTGE